MAYQPKKGMFEYNLATVLRVRRIFEKREQKIFQEKEKAYRKQLEQEITIKKHEREQADALAENLQGKIEDFSTVLHRHAYLGKVKEDVLQEEQKTIEADQKKEEQREKLIKAVVDRRVMEKDEDRKKDIWKGFIKKEEMKFFDDLSNSAFTRRKLFK